MARRMRGRARARPNFSLIPAFVFCIGIERCHRPAPIVDTSAVAAEHYVANARRLSQFGVKARLRRESGPARIRQAGRPPRYQSEVRRGPTPITTLMRHVRPCARRNGRSRGEHGTVTQWLRTPSAQSIAVCRLQHEASAGGPLSQLLQQQSGGAKRMKLRICHVTA